MIRSLHSVVTELVDEMLSTNSLTPIYIEGIHTVERQEKIAGQLPMFYVWKDRNAESDFTMSVNGIAVANLVALSIGKESELAQRVISNVMGRVNTICTDVVRTKAEETGDHIKDVCAAISGRRGFVDSERNLSFFAVDG